MLKIYITQFDYDRLMKLLSKRLPHNDNDQALLAELERGEIVAPKDIPSDTITMNSQVRFKDEFDEAWDYWLVFPEDADITKNKISVLSPIGCALLGYRKGDTVTIPTPKGRRELTVVDIVHQPEREGNFEL